MRLQWEENRIASKIAFGEAATKQTQVKVNEIIPEKIEDHFISFEKESRIMNKKRKARKCIIHVMQFH